MPKDASFALVRQMQLIDDRGRLTLTPVTETLQVRRGPNEHESRLSRAELMAGKPSLAAVGPEDRERAFLNFLGGNAGGRREKVMNSCSSCHRSNVLESHDRLLGGSPVVHPPVEPSERAKEEGRARRWKVDRYEWGLLQGLMLAAGE